MVSAQIAVAPQKSVFAKFDYADLLRLRSVEDVAMSPDGGQIAYTVSAIDPQKDEATESLWVLRVANKQTVQVALPSAGTAAWSPDGHRLAVVSRGKEGKSMLSLLRTDELKVLQFFPLPSAPDDLAWSPDGRSIAFSLFVPDVVDPSFLQTAINRAEADLGRSPAAQWAPPVQLTQAARYRRDGGIWLKPGHTHLFVLSTAGGKLRQIGREPFDDMEPAWTPDSATLLFTSDRRPDRAYSQRELSIYKTDLATGDVLQLTHTSGNFGSPSASPDGKWIAYTEYGIRHVNYTRTDLYVMRPDGTASHRLALQLDRDIYAPQWASDAQGVYGEYADHGILRVRLFGLDSTVKELASGVDTAFSISRKGDVAYSGNTATTPNELKLQRVGAAPVDLTSLNDFLHQRELGHLTHLETRSSADGVPVEGWALLPAGTSDSTKLPTILIMHGGPFGSDGPDWSSKFQLYAAAGYAVVYANSRGSTSYGTAFSEPANQNFPGLAYDDLMSIVNEAVRRGFADPQRLFVIGHSAGGTLTTWITGKTKRFKAAVAGKPVINQLSKSLATDQYLAAAESAGALPWTREKELWVNSPLSLASSMTTPMLFIIGEEDYRTPLDQTLQLYDALQLQDVPTALMRVPGAGHESLESRPSQFAAETAATLAWFHK